MIKSPNESAVSDRKNTIGSLSFMAFYTADRKGLVTKNSTGPSYPCAVFMAAYAVTIGAKGWISVIKRVNPDGIERPFGNVTFVTRSFLTCMCIAER